MEEVARDVLSVGVGRMVCARTGTYLNLSAIDTEALVDTMPGLEELLVLGAGRARTCLGRRHHRHRRSSRRGGQ